MASRLSSLLVRDGLIGVKRMERAFQRQVIYGGALDTILLEMSLVDEASLCDYLSLATGLPPATKGQMDIISSDATDLCSEAVAVQHNVAPLAIDGDALRVLVCEPVDFAQLEDLADALDLAIQPLVVPEFRFHLARSRAYARKPDARFLKLAEGVGEIEPLRRPPTEKPVAAVSQEADTAPSPEAESAAENNEPAAKAAEAEANETTPAVDDAPTADADREIVDVPLPPTDPSPSVRATMRMSSDALAARLGASLEVRRISDAYRIVRPARPGATGVPEATEAQPTPRETPRSIEAEKPPRAATEPIEIEAEPRSRRESDRFSASYKTMTDAIPDGVPHVDAHGVVSGEIADEPTPAPAKPSGAVLSSLSVADAEELLERADDRDLIFSLLLRGLSRVANYAALLSVQGGAAIGRMALDDGAIESDTVSTILIPLGLPSPFQQAVQSKSPYIGRLASGVEEVDGQAKLLGGIMAPTALLLPVVLRDRVVALAVGHCGEDTIEVTEVSEVFRLAEASASALARLIRKAKHKTAPQPIQKPPADLDGSETDAPDAGSAPDARDAPEPSPEPDAGEVAEAEAEAPVQRDRRGSLPIRDEEIEELLDEIDSDDLAVAAAAKRALLGRSAEVVPLLDDRFPGKLRVDRYEVGWRTIRAGQYGQMMNLVVELGAACGPMLASKLQDPRRDIRYYAAVCAAELRPEAALRALVDRIFDRDYGVRDISIHALGGYPVRELENALSVARRALDSDDGERVMAAANALAVLGDLGAIPALLDVLDSGRELGEPARRSLRRLTAQDFGNNVRKWRNWWNKNRERPRVEWLLDSLSHKDDELRRRAVDDLRTLTGESFGFHAEANKRDRETARKQWLEWWDASGKHRFSPAARAERSRQTAKIPRL